MLSKMLAVCTTGKADGTTEVRSVDIPRLGDDEIRVKVEAAAANPADWKILSFIKDVAILGSDFAGVVTELGASVVEGHFKVGDRVAGYVLGGGFSEYVNACPWTMMKIPESMPFETAAQLMACGLTACQVLYHAQTLPSPESPASSPIDLLVWGGASSAGHFTVQLAQLGGMRVIATASPKHFDRLKALGADEVFDYRDPEVSKKIRAYTNGNLEHAVDCIAEGSTPQQVADSMSAEGGTVSSLLRNQSNRPEVKHIFSAGIELLGKPFTFGPFSVEGKPEMAEFSRKSSRMLERLVAEGKVLPAPIKLFSNGLAGVQEGLEYLKSGKASGEKVVVRISDTPGLKA
ncbi:hypothetical protein D9758_010197 [Tetrapyrgos nigripes]|uniref:Enoyl reductase (ER) domain-containing protein n=1 Tax=Tetrapyrgos nigripes TaxID=182062 RepID=A0A8H5CY61_9AGAR|nr:hypothetical protein D9758_010197 [Tetrapyrgos nigripes]